MSWETIPFCPVHLPCASSRCSPSPFVHATLLAWPVRHRRHLAWVIPWLIGSLFAGGQPHSHPDLCPIRCSCRLSIRPHEGPDAPHPSPSLHERQSHPQGWMQHNEPLIAGTVGHPLATLQQSSLRRSGCRLQVAVTLESGRPCPSALKANFAIRFALI